MVAASFVNRHKQVNKDMVNVYFSSRTFFNMNSVPEISLNWELENVDQLIKRLFSSNEVPNIPIARRLKHFSKSSKKLNQGSEYPGFSRWLCNTFSKETFSIKDSFQIGNKLKTTKTDGHGSDGNVEGGGNKTSQYSKGRVLKQFFPCKKEGWRAKASNKPETSKYIYIMHSLQNGRIAEFEVFVTRRRLYVQARSKGCILLCSFTEKLEEICSVPLVRKLIQISVLMFWLGSCPANFHKIIENPNCNFASHNYKNGYFLG